MAPFLQHLFRQLRLKWATYREQIFPADPYLQHLEQLIKYRAVPFSSVDDLFAHQVDKKFIRQIHLLLCIVFLNLFRLTVVVVHPTPFVRYYFVHYFDGQANSWYFHLSLLAIFFLPSVLYVNFYLTSSRTVATHSRTFALFEGIIRRGEYRLPPGRIRRLNFGMRFFPLMHEVVFRAMRFCFLVLPLVDVYLNFQKFKTVHALMFAFWNTVLLVGIHLGVGVGVLLAQQVYFLSVYHRHRLLTLKERLSKALKFHFLQKAQPNTFVHNLLGKHLSELTTLSAVYLHQNEQFKYMPAVSYYTMSAIFEFNFYLALSRPTKAMLRAIAVVTAAGAAFFYFQVFALMAQLHSSSKQLLPELNRCLFCVVWKRKSRKLTLAETQHLIAADRFSISVADIFSMTRLQLLLACFGVVQNVFLIIDLNDYQ